MVDPNERVESLLIEDEMKESYLSYAMSVIISRALPDVRDGLKPSQRRVLVAMNDLGLGPRAKYRKCAKITGDTNGNYHPHGNQAIYPTLVRMAQDFSLRYPLVQGQGNFGSIDGDPPAAERYTEARMTQGAVDLLADLEYATVDMVPTYDNSRDEPTVLPGRFPNLLCNGSNGIAVGMATSIPPHNLREICAAIERVLEDPDVTSEQLLEQVPGPDFPTGAMICGRKGIHDAYTTGRGQVTVRARVAVEEDKRGRKSLIVSEIPFQLNKTLLIETMAERVKDGQIPGVSDIRDESDKEGMRIVVELKKGEDEHVTLNQLFKFTQLESKFSIINIAIVNGRPQTMTLKAMIVSYIAHRRDVIRRRTRFLLTKAEDRLHIVEGLKIAVDHIDEVVRTIRNADDVEDARAKLMARFELTERQANAILSMQLRTLTGLERDKIEQERQELIAEIARLRAILADPKLVDDLIRGDLQDLRDKYPSARRTEITAPVDAMEDEDLIPDDSMAVTVSHHGYVKRLALDTYRRQGRGGVGITGGESKEEDFLEHLFVAQNHDSILFFTDRGKVHWLKVHQIPQLSRQSKGRSVQNLLRLDEGETVTSMIPVRDFSRGYLFMATRSGMVKKTPLIAFARPKLGGIIALGLKEDDALVGVAVVSQDDEVMLGTQLGLAIRFPAAKARAMGRTARGVHGIKPGEGDRVIGLIVVDPTAHVLTVGSRGLGKRTEFAEYRVTNRGGKGIINMKVTDRTGEVVALKAVRDGDDLMMMTVDGMVVRIAVSGISVLGRNAQGVKLISLRDKDRLAAVAPVVKDDTEGEAPRAMQDEPAVEAPEEGDDDAGDPGDSNDDGEPGGGPDAPGTDDETDDDA